MSDIDVETALAAVRAAALNGSVAGATTTRNGRGVYMTLLLEDAELQVVEAATLAWDDDDDDRYHVHVTTPLGRLIRLDAVHPDGPPRPIG